MIRIYSDRMPGHLMGMARVDVPSVMAAGGTMT